jgi:hypothetical protein
MAFRWLCQPKEFIFLIRYTTFADELKNNPIVDFWVCKEGDQVLVTNIPGEDKIFLGEDNFITLPLNKDKNNHEINPINGIIHELCEIYPGDRILWLAKSKDQFSTDEHYYIHAILKSRTHATLSGFSNPKQIISIDELPLSFGYEPSITEIPINLHRVCHTALREIKTEWVSDNFKSPMDEIGKLLNELIEMSKKSTKAIYSPNRKVYLGRNKKRVIEIGKKLNNIGGIYLMILVARQVPEYDIGELNFAWSGIGEWMA